MPHGGKPALRQAGLLPLGLGSGDDSFGYFFHGFALLTALATEGQIGLFFAQAGLPLQDALGAFDDFAGFELFGQLRAFFFEAGHFDFGADEKADGGDEADFAFVVGVRLAILQIDDAHRAAAAQQRNRQEGFVAVFGEFIEELEALILKGVARDGHGLMVFGDPSGNSLPQAQREMADFVGMRILGGAQDEFVFFKHEDEAGVEASHGGGKIDNAVE